jgi:hypothetical protein
LFFPFRINDHNTWSLASSFYQMSRALGSAHQSPVPTGSELYSFCPVDAV